MYSDQGWNFIWLDAPHSRGRSVHGSSVDSVKPGRTLGSDTDTHNGCSVRKWHPIETAPQGGGGVSTAEMPSEPVSNR